MKVLIFLCALVAAVSADFLFKNAKPMEMVYPVPPHLRRFTPIKNDGSRIVGGQEARPHQFPHQVALFFDTSDGTFFCGGSLISRNYVLTAGHCADGARNFTVILGAQYVQQIESSQVRLQVPGSNAVVHPRWNPSTISNDIAIIKLTQSVQLNDAIQTIALPSKSQAGDSFAGVTGTVSGWGKASDNAGGISPVLRYVDRPIITNTLCDYYYGNVLASNVCTSGDNGKATCSGDSGGPLYVATNNKKVQVGIVSYGSAAGCEIGYPSAFTRVTSYLDWISQNTDVVIN